MQKLISRVDTMGKKTNPAGDKQQTSGVIRTIVILETLSKHQSINLEQLSKETGLPKATLLRFLSTLVNLGYVYRDNTDLYSLTLKMFSVGSRGLEHIDLIHVANPVAQKLCDELGETVHMGVLEEDNAVYVLKQELQQIRDRGWASDNEEHEMGTLCIGSPIKDYTGKVIAAMSVSWPLFRFNPEEQEHITKSILEACTNLSHLLGWEEGK